MTDTEQEKRIVMEFVKAKRMAESLEESAKQAKADFRAIQETMQEYLINLQKTSTATYEGYGRVQITKPLTYASCNAENMSKLVEYLRKIGRDDLIIETVGNTSIKHFVKECEENGEVVPEMINVTKKEKLVHHQPK